MFEETEDERDAEAAVDGAVAMSDEARPPKRARCATFPRIPKSFACTLSYDCLASSAPPLMYRPYSRVDSRVPSSIPV